MAASSVTILCPNARRVVVKTTPNTSILQILEEACTKQNYNPDEYSLKHLRRPLDMTGTVRFAGIPNRCVLEMVSLTTPRVHQPVTVGVIDQDGGKHLHDFMPSTSLWSVLEEAGVVGAAISPGLQPVVVYSLRRVAGRDELQRTTLSCLGLSSGRGTVRFLLQPVDDAGPSSASGGGAVGGGSAARPVLPLESADMPELIPRQLPEVIPVNAHQNARLPDINQNENMPEFIPVHANQPEIIPPNHPEAMHADNQPEIIPVNNQPELIPVHQPEVLSLNQQALMPVNNQPEIIPVNQPEVIPINIQPEVIPVNNQPEVIPVHCQPEVIPPHFQNPAFNQPEILAPVILQPEILVPVIPAPLPPTSASGTCDVTQSPDVVSSSQGGAVPDVVMREDGQPPDVLAGEGTSSTVVSAFTGAGHSLAGSVSAPPLAEPPSQLMEVDSTQDTADIALSSHSAVVFRGSAEQRVAPVAQAEEDDSFYELTAEEVRRLHREQVRELQQLSEVPLMTQGLREAQEQGRLLAALNRFPVTHLRIHFPGDVVVQGHFRPTDSVQDVAIFVGQLLRDEAAEFDLLGQYPRRPLPRTSTLHGCGLVPRARLHCRVAGGEAALHPAVLARLTDYSIAQDALVSHRSNRDLAGLQDLPSSSSGDGSQLGPAQFAAPRTSAAPGDAKKPKWFKLGK